MTHSIQSQAQGKKDSSRNSKNACGMRVKTHIRAGDGGPPQGSGGSGGGGDLDPNHNETMLRLPRKGMRVKTHIKAGPTTGGGGGGGGDLDPNHNETML